MIAWFRAATVPLAAVLLAACAANPAQRPESTRVQTAGTANLQLGIAYLQQNNLPLAKEKLERAEVLIPNDPTLQAALALLAERLGNEREAEQHYRRTAHRARQPRHAQQLRRVPVPHGPCGRGRAPLPGAVAQPPVPQPGIGADQCRRVPARRGEARRCRAQLQPGARGATQSRGGGIPAR
ncbi:MAG: hypothetical protein U1F11_10055 [Steroidobacteraceae bacterium]